VFRQITGKEAPELLQVQIENIENKKIVGFYSASLNKIVIGKGLDYLITLAAGFHEFGHCAYQGGEAFMYQRKGDEKDIKTMEEAAAYLFTMIGIKEFDKRSHEIAMLMAFFEAYDKTEFIRGYNQGSNDEHSTGAALADALLVHFKGDCSKAFNYISTRNELREFDPGILSVYRSYRKAVPHDPKKLDDDIKSQVQRIGRLVEGYEHVNDKYPIQDKKPANPDEALLPLTPPSK